MSTTSDALKIVGIGAGIGGALGAVGAATGNAPIAPSTIAGATGGAALTALFGLAWAITSATGITSKSSTDEALQVAGLGLAGTIVGRLL